MSKYWENFYEENKIMPPSSFAHWVLPYIKEKAVDLGCGNGRDLNYFLQHGKEAVGVDVSFESDTVIKMDVAKYMEENEAPDAVYTRFFWHSIGEKTQKKIMEWSKEYLFIEARTTEDEGRNKTYPHARNYVDVPNLIKDLKSHNYQIIKLEEGEFSPFGEENPHLVRLIAKK